jgi:hypothetical protein
MEAGDISHTPLPKGRRARRRYLEKRRLYAGGRPSDEVKAIHRRFNSSLIPRLLPIACVLQVRGRSSGELRSVPLVIVPWRRRWYLASMLGDDANWVLNVRAAHGEASLLHGRQRNVRLVEIAPDQRPAILRRYLLFAWGARPHVDVRWISPRHEFEQVADRYPVFRVERR